jgi:hypothetical protein
MRDDSVDSQVQSDQLASKPVASGLLRYGLLWGILSLSLTGIFLILLRWLWRAVTA